MTDLIQAIAELRRDGPEDATWTASLVADGNPYQSSLAGAVATTLNAALSGDLIPKADADLAVALMVEVTAERSSLSAMFATQAEETQAAEARIAELEAIIRGKTFTVDEAAELKAEVERLRGDNAKMAAQLRLADVVMSKASARRLSHEPE